MFNGQAITKKYFGNQEILRTIYNNMVIWQMQKSIVTNGLVLWLDGKDFTNSPPTDVWKSKVLLDYEYTNLVNTSDFSDLSKWGGYPANISVSNNVLTVTGRPHNPALWVCSDTTSHCKVGHKIYMRAKIKTLDSTFSKVRFAYNSTDNIYYSGQQYINIEHVPTVNVEEVFSVYYTVRDTYTSGNIRFQLAFNFSDNSPEGKQVELSEIMYVDLTEIFGTDIPTKEWCDENLKFTTTSIDKLILPTPIKTLPHGIKDTVNVSKQTYTQNVEEVVLNGIGDWRLKTTFTNNIQFGLTPYMTQAKVTPDVVCTESNIIQSVSNNNWNNDIEGILFMNNNELRISIDKNKLTTQDVVGFKQWLSENPITLNYQLATPIVSNNGENGFSLTFTGDKAIAKRGTNATVHNFSYTNESGSDGEGGVVLDGVDDYIFLNNSLYQTFSIHTKLNVKEFKNYNPIIHDNNGVTGNFQFRLDANGLIQIRKYGGETYYSLFKLSLNTDYNITLTYENLTVKLYVDGSFIGSHTFAEEFVLSDKFNIGWYTGYAYSNMAIKNCIIYDRALTEQEILQNYEILNPPKPSIIKDGLILWLDGEDFTNEPQTTEWKSKVLFDYEYTNLYGNGDFSKGLTNVVTYFATSSVNGNILTNTSNGSWKDCSLRFQTNFTCNSDLVYFKANIKLDNTVCEYVNVNYMGSTTGTEYFIAQLHNPLQNNWYEISGIATTSNLTGDLILAFSHNYTDSATANGNSMDVKEVISVNLTEMFGANIPSKEWCDENLTFVPTTSIAKRGNNVIPNNFAYTEASGSDGQGGLVFDGLGDFCNCITNASLQITGELTLELLIKGNPQLGKAILMKYDGATGNRGFGITTGKTGLESKVRFMYQSIGSSFNSSETLNCNYDVLDGTYNHVVCVFKPSEYTRIYINSSLDAESTTNIPSALFESTADITMGAYGNLAEAFNGTIKVARIYAKALSEQEIKQNYDALGVI